MAEQPEERLHHLRALQSAAVRLGQLLEHAGTFSDDVPREVWDRIAQAGAEIAAAAKALAGGHGSGGGLEARVS